VKAVEKVPMLLAAFRERAIGVEGSVKTDLI
jgi:hypothetical protein